MTFNKAQTDQLLRPIHPSRIVRAQGHSHVSQQDILAHLNRVFGFGNFDIDVLEVAHVFTENYVSAKTKEITGGYNVCYRALVKVTIRDLEGKEMCHYVNGSTATSQNQSLGDGHDLAYKSAISLSVKRACIALGDQFGLSLYNRGQEEALIMASIAYLPVDDKKDVQDGVTEQVSLGNDEVEKEEVIEAEVVEKKLEPVKVKETAVVSEELTAELRQIFSEIVIAPDMKRLLAIGNAQFPKIDILFSFNNFATGATSDSNSSITLRQALEQRKSELGAKP